MTGYRTKLSAAVYVYAPVTHPMATSPGSYHDCGVTDLHTVRNPTNPKAPPTFIRQYKTQFTAYKSIQEILEKLL